MINTFLAAAAAVLVSASAASADPLAVDEQTRNEIAHTLGMAPEAEDKEFGTKGYDLDSLSEIYGFTLSRYIGSYSISEGIDSDKPYYMISFDNSSARGDATLERDGNGGFRLVDTGVYADNDRSQYSDSNFYHSKIAELTESYGGITELRLLQDPFECLNLVYFKSGGEEYVIPYWFLADSEERGAAIPGNTVYPKAEFDELISKSTETPEQDGQIGGGIVSPETAKSEQTAAVSDEKEQEKSRLPLCIGLAAGAAAVLAAGAVLAKRLRGRP